MGIKGETQTPNPKPQTPNLKPQTASDEGFKKLLRQIEDIEFRFWVLGFGFWVLGFGFWVLGFGFVV
jgi:hypothetical protein